MGFYMDRIEGFLALIVFLLAALVYETGDKTTPEFIAIPVMIILFVFPLYVIASVVFESLGNE